MRIGLVNELHGRPDGPTPPPNWETIGARVLMAEEVGFDVFVFEDALLYRGEKATDGVWEATTIAAALAATTHHITIAPSVINSPYRSPAMVAKIAETIDEISAGRFVLGIGAGNTPDSDYWAFGFPTDKRYSRFAEAIQIIHALLKTGTVDFEGEFYSAKDAEMVLRGPRTHGPPINIAAGSPKMLGLAARYGDQWNWWGWGETLEQIRTRLTPIIETLEAACREEDRDPGGLVRTFDLYTVVPEPYADRAGEAGVEHPVTGSAAAITEYILDLGEMGFTEVRCDVWPRTIDAVEAMSDVVRMVHSA
jgi:alkanesulfonate monooxygenase SsuD/methylene tetrahydromethanopterin reductase-like flavin-dependent oxidoreductase (luciferase family)